MSSNTLLLRARELTGHASYMAVRERRLLRELQPEGFVRLQRVGCPSSLAVDALESRYLLVGDTTGGLSVHDTQREPACMLAWVCGKKKKRHQSTISSCLWYPEDQGILVTASTDRTVKIWDSNRMKPVDSINVGFPVISATMSTVPASKPLIAVCTKSSSVHIVNMETGSALQHLRAHSDTPYVACWSTHTATQLVTAGTDGAAYVWDVRNARSPLCQLAFPGNRSLGPIHGACFSPDGLHLALVHSGGFVSLFDGLLFEPYPAARSEPLLMNCSGFDNNYLIPVAFASQRHLLVPALTRLVTLDAGDALGLPAADVGVSRPRLPLSASALCRKAHRCSRRFSAYSRTFTATRPPNSDSNPHSGSTFSSTSAGRAPPPMMKVARVTTAHVKPITCMQHVPLTGDVFTGASDGSLLRWSANSTHGRGYDAGDGRVGGRKNYRRNSSSGSARSEERGGDVSEFGRFRNGDLTGHSTADESNSNVSNGVQLESDEEDSWSDDAIDGS